MRQWLSIIALLPMLLAPAAMDEGRFKGCIPQAKIEAALQLLHDSDWAALSTERVKSMWPHDLHEDDCNPEYCGTLRSQDRIIGGVCECCEAFFFKVDGALLKANSEHLVDVVINYGASTSHDALNAAKSFALALGLPESEASRVKVNAEQDFSWKQSGGNKLSLLTVGIGHKGDRWAVYLNHQIAPN